MYVSGFTFVRNAVKFDYPVVESIRSLLPLVDELVVVLGNSEDDTEQLIRNIGDPRIRIIQSVWDDTLREGGKVLAVETNKALRAVDKAADWCVYLQADEIIHENDYPLIRQSMKSNLADRKVQGLLFNYVHFYGSYAYVGNSRRWYRNEIRIVRNDPHIHSFRDAQGFRIDGKILRVKNTGAQIFHYGWVKTPLHQLEKQKSFHRLWHSDEKVGTMVADVPFDYSGIDSLGLFAGSHPSVMQARVRRQDWDFEFDVSQKKFGFKDRILWEIEKATGKRLFEYRNYKLI